MKNYKNNIEFNSIIKQKSEYDRLITIVMIVLGIILFTAFQLSAQNKKQKINDRHNKTITTQSATIPNAPQATGDKVTIKDGSTILMEIENEGSAGSIKLNDAGAVSPSTNKLYNNGGNLYWNGNAISTGSGVTEINDLTDAKYDGSSLFIGNSAGANDDGTSNSNTAIGKYALYNNTTGYSNTAIGENALYNNTTGYSNTANGREGLKSNTTGSANTANGSFALFYNTTGDYNVGLGYNANRLNAEGSRNTIIGYHAGRGGNGETTHNKSGNIFLGYQAGFNELSNNKLYIENSNSSSPLIWGDFANDIAAINGKLGVGTMSPTDRVTIIADAAEVGLRVKIGTGTKFKVESNGGVAIGANYGSTPANGLYVNGKTKLTSLQVTTGASNGYILTSDAAGNATWQASSSGGASEINDLNDGKTTSSSLYLGSTAGEYDDGGSNSNTGLGIGSLSSESISGTNGQRNSAVGYFSLNANHSGQSNTANGYYALSSNATGDNNTAIGRSSAGLNTSGQRNVAIGAWANLNNNTGSYNTMIGYEAGRGTGSTGRPVTGNIFIGYQAGGNETTDNKLFIENSNSSSPLIWGDFATDSVKINGNLNVSGNITTDIIYSVGDYAQGGYVFEVTPNGKHGLVVTLNDQVAANGSSGANFDSAINYCTDESKHIPDGANYKDWRIPTKREWQVIYSNKSAIDAMANSKGGTQFGSSVNKYWTTQINPINTVEGYYMNMDTGNLTITNRLNLMSVRCVRAF